MAWGVEGITQVMQVNKAKRKCGMGDVCGVFWVLRSAVGNTEMPLCKVVGCVREGYGEGF